MWFSRSVPLAVPMRLRLSLIPSDGSARESSTLSRSASRPSSCRTWKRALTRGRWFATRTGSSGFISVGHNECFSFGGDFVVLWYVDGFGESVDAAGADSDLVWDAPVVELGVGAFARAVEPGMDTVGVLQRLGFVLAFVRGDHPFPVLVIAVVALVTQRDQPGLFQRGPDP